MAQKGFLKNRNGSFLPITRGELVVDSSGGPAFSSDNFLATSSNNGLMSANDKQKLDSINQTQTKESLTLKINSGSNENTDLYTFNGSSSKTLDIVPGNNVYFTTGTNRLIINAETITSLDWNKITNKPSEFTPIEHNHISDNITIANYTIEGIKANEAISNNDTLTQALSKLEVTASTAYLWYKSITEEDTDDVINKWGEIVDFVNSISSNEDIKDSFVTTNTEQEITGLKTFVATENTAPFKVNNNILVENLNANYLNGYDASEFASYGNAYWANIPITQEENCETEPTFKSVNSKSYILNSNNNTELINVSAPSDDAVVLNAFLKDVLVLEAQDIPVLRPYNKNTPNAVNYNMKLGDSDYKWSEVYASKFVMNSPATKDDTDSVYPLLVNDEGIIERSSNLNVGSYTKFIYMQNGCLIPASTPIGNANKGIYYASDGIKTMTYSLSANVNSGTAGKLVKYTGANALGNATTAGSATKGIYLNDGTPTSMTYSLSANVNSGTAGKLVYYSGANDLSAFGNAGDIDTPVYIKNGVVTPITVSQSESELYLVGVKSRENDENGTLNQLCTGIQGFNTGVRMINGTTVYAKGGFYEASDERLKNFEEPIEVDFNALGKIPKKYFTWLDSSNGSRQIGTSAQELQKLYPELVEEDNSGTLHVAYDKLSVVALKAVDDLYHMIKDLKASHDDLKARLELLESRV